MGYVIVTDRRNDTKIKSFLAHNSTNDKKWSVNLQDAVIFAHKHVADGILKRYKHNNPKVITLLDAKIIDMTNQHISYMNSRNR